MCQRLHIFIQNRDIIKSDNVNVSTASHFRTEKGHCSACRRKWRHADTDLCPCVETQTRCTLSNRVLWQSWMAAYRLHSADEDAVSWLTNYSSWHAYGKKKYWSSSGSTAQIWNKAATHWDAACSSFLLSVSYFGYNWASWSFVFVILSFSFWISVSTLL